MKKALITGIGGQDGSYLAELLLEKGYDVFGVAKSDLPTGSPLKRLDAIRSTLTVFSADVADFTAMSDVIGQVQPDEIYNLASQSHVMVSFDQPLMAFRTAGIGALNVLEAVRVDLPSAKIFQASTSEIFGDCVEDDGFQRETTAKNPASPYASAKLFAHNIVRNYRTAYKLFASSTILYNHESPRREISFVTGKICKEAVRIKYGLANSLELGNVDACRDWGHAKDYVRAMWMILQHDEPDDFICSSGVTHGVRDVVKYVFDRLNLDWQTLVKVDPKLLRREDERISKGDNSKIRRVLGWEPEYTFETMLDEMIDHWLTELKPIL